MCEMYIRPVNYSGEEDNNDQALWTSQETIEEDKVILETEITLKTGPNITMKIHEESRPSSVISGAFESEEDSDKQGVIKVLNDDSESDYYDRKSPRTPRKVRFGGESFKLRTPESDSSHQTEDDENEMSTIKITVTDAVSIRTRKSLIPIRISSLPSTPKKSFPYHKSSRNHYMSAPNLTITSSSKIPLRKRTMQNVQNQTNEKPDKTKVGHNTSYQKASPSQSSKNEPQNATDQDLKEQNLKPRILKHSRAEDILSPIPIHDEIEVFHNLTRSPERSRRNSLVQKLEEDMVTKNATTQFPNGVTQKEAPLKISSNSSEENENKQVGPVNQDVTKQSDDAKSYNSFTVYEENDHRMISKSTETSVAVEGVPERHRLNVAVNGKKSSLQLSLSSLTSDDEVWAKSEALESVIKMLKEPGTCEALEAGPAALLFEALFACHHRDRLHSLADDALAILIQGLKREVLEQCVSRLALSICKMGASSGVRCALVVMKKLPPRKLQSEILSKGFGHRTREGALQILMACARLYPRQDVEVAKNAEFAALALRDRRRRVRQAALETLAAVAQISTTHEVLIIVEATIKDFTDFEEIMQVVRTRLSRKQLPTVDLDGSIRYSSPAEQRESDWISGAALKTTNVSSSPLSSASSSTHSVNYWMHNSRHDNRFNNGSTFVKQLSESCEEDAFDDAAKIYAIDANSYSKNGKTPKGPRARVLRPVYILQPDVPSAENGKHGRGHRKYDRGRSFSPPKQYRGQYPSGLVEAIPIIPVHNNNNGNFNDADKHSGQPDASSRLQYPDPGNFRPHGFRKSFSSDQLYFNDRLPPKHEPYSYSLSSRSSSTSTGSSTRSGFWHKDFRSGIPVPISETKLKIRHSTSSIVSSGGPLIAKRSAVVSPQHTPTSSKASLRERTTIAQDNDSISHLSLPPPRSSGSDSSGYYTPSPPDTHPPAFIKMDTEERLSSDTEEQLDPAVNNNSRDCVDSYSAESVDNERLQAKDIEVENIPTFNLAENSDCLGEAIHDNYPSIESINLKNEDSAAPEERPPSHKILLSESIPTTIEVRRKSKSVVDLPNFLPKIITRKSINSAPPRNEENSINNNIEDKLSDTNENAIPPISVMPLPSVMPITHMDYSLDHQEEIECSTTPTVTKSKLERRFSRKSSRKSLKVSPRVPPEAVSRSASKPKEVLQHVLHQMENPNWETIVEGLQGLTKLARQHPEVIEHQIHNVCVTLGKHIKNLRSQVARSACNMSCELFLSCKRGLDVELEEIAVPLLQRTADTNRFLRSDANAALDIMCDQLPAHRIIPVVTLKGCGHQNAIVRAAALRLLVDMVRRLGVERVFQMPKELRDKLLLAGANSLADGNLEARSQGKSLFRYLMEHPHFQKYLHEAVPQNILRHISKGLLSIKSDA